LMDLAREEKDYATQGLIQWYIDEQVEEEASMLAILKKIRMVGEKGHGIFMLDEQLKGRQFNQPAGEYGFFSLEAGEKSLLISPSSLLSQIYQLF